VFSIYYNALNPRQHSLSPSRIMNWHPLSDTTILAFISLSALLLCNRWLTLALLLFRAPEATSPVSSDQQSTCEEETWAHSRLHCPFCFCPYGRRRKPDYPLGPTLTSDGVNFSVFSAHATQVEIVFFEQRDAQQPPES